MYITKKTDTSTDSSLNLPQHSDLTEEIKKGSLGTNEQHYDSLGMEAVQTNNLDSDKDPPTTTDEFLTEFLTADFGPATPDTPEIPEQSLPSPSIPAPSSTPSPSCTPTPVDSPVESPKAISKSHTPSPVNLKKKLTPRAYTSEESVSSRTLRGLKRKRDDEYRSAMEKVQAQQEKLHVQKTDVVNEAKEQLKQVTSEVQQLMGELRQLAGMGKEMISEGITAYREMAEYYRLKKEREVSKKSNSSVLK